LGGKGAARTAPGGERDSVRDSALGINGRNRAPR